ncbi:MAG: cation diffusion facilitator family transporter [Bacillota bacterium]
MLSGNKNGLIIALAITFVFMLVEAVGGWLTNSLALLSDSAHMLSDVGSLAISLVAVWFVARPPSRQKSYGYQRMEILAALLNGVALFVVAGFIIWEAYSRLAAPPAVAAGSMMVIALFGLLANIASAWALLRNSDVKNNINIKSAYLHVLSDALGSVGALLAGLLMQVYGWYIADPIISVIVAVLVLKSAWRLITQAVHILMEGTPGNVAVADIVRELTAIDGVVGVHDIHVWQVTAGYDVFSCHITVLSGTNATQILAQAVPLLEQKFGLRHTTIQVEEQGADISSWGCQADGAHK